ncbi:transcription factor MYB119-like protein [Tanacetum coccineum]
MESGNQGGSYPNFGKSQKHPLVPPLMTAIGRLLQGQSSQSHSSHHNFEINKEQFIPSNGVYGFSSSSNEGISGMYNKYEVPSAHCLPMDKMFAADHGIYSRSYRNMHLNNEVIKSCTEIKSKGGSGKSLIKGQWTDEEDKKLLRLVKLHGERKWAHIAEQMIGRAGKQCRERWHNHLRPDIKLNFVTAAIVFAVCQANDLGFGGLGGFSALAWMPCVKGLRPICLLAFRIIPSCLLLAVSIANVAIHGSYRVPAAAFRGYPASWKQRKDLWAAEETLLEAIVVDPINPYYAATYANFLWSKMDPTTLVSP